MDTFRSHMPGFFAARDNEANDDTASDISSSDSTSTVEIGHTNLNPKASRLSDSEQRTLLLGFLQSFFEPPPAASPEVRARILDRGKQLRAVVNAVFPTPNSGAASGIVAGEHELVEESELDAHDLADLDQMEHLSFQEEGTSDTKTSSMLKSNSTDANGASAAFDATTGADASIVRIDAEYASLVQVLLELCNDWGRCHASQVAVVLRARDPDFFTRSGRSSFKKLVLEAHDNGAPVEFYHNYWSGPMVELTLSQKIRDSFKMAREENSKLMMSEFSLLPTIGSTVVYHKGQGLCLPHGNWATPNFGLGALPSATSCPTICDDDLS